MAKSNVRRVRRRGRTRLVLDFSYTDTNGKRRRYRRDATAQTMAGARAEAQRLVALAAATGDPYPRERGRTLAKFVEEVYEPLYLPRLKPGSIESYRWRLRRHVLPALGGMSIAGIDGLAVRRFDAAIRSKGINPSPLVLALRSVLRAAVDSGDLAEFPSRLPTYRAPRKLPTCATMEHVGQVLVAAPPWLQPAIAIMAYAGLRVGEARALRAMDVDLAAGALYVRRTYSGDIGGGQVVETTKGGKDRMVPIADALRPYLVDAIRDKLPQAPLLLTPKGRVPTRHNIGHGLRRAAARAGVERIGPHGHRHAFCSALLRGGASVEAVRLLAGHADLATTARYLHVVGGELRSAIGRIWQPEGNGQS